MEKDDYKLPTPPPGYDRMRNSLLVALTLAILSAVAGIRFLSMDSVADWLWIVVGGIFLSSTAWIAYVFLVGSKKYPNWRSYYQKILEPNSSVSSTQETELQIPLAQSTQTYQIGRVVIAGGFVLAAIGIAALKDNTRIEIYRHLLHPNENALFEFVRSHGVLVRLRDSVQSVAR